MKSVLLILGLTMVAVAVYAVRRVWRRPQEDVPIAFDSVDEARRWLAKARIVEGEQQVEITIKRLSRRARKRLARIDDEI